MRSGTLWCALLLYQVLRELCLIILTSLSPPSLLSHVSDKAERFERGLLARGLCGVGLPSIEVSGSGVNSHACHCILLALQRRWKKGQWFVFVTLVSKLNTDLKCGSSCHPCHSIPAHCQTQELLM